VNSRDKRPNSRIATLHCAIVKAPDSQKRIVAQMAEIRIDAEKAERMIAQILPINANAVGGSSVVQRILAATVQ
jgi:hypothetical protein